MKIFVARITVELGKCEMEFAEISHCRNLYL